MGGVYHVWRSIPYTAGLSMYNGGESCLGLLIHTLTPHFLRRQVVIAARCYAALGDIAKTRFLHKVGAIMRGGCGHPSGDEVVTPSVGDDAGEDAGRNPGGKCVHTIVGPWLGATPSPAQTTFDPQLAPPHC